MDPNPETDNPTTSSESGDDCERELCFYAEKYGVCCFIYEEFCPFLHRDVCDFCGGAALHPYNRKERRIHIQKCFKRRALKWKQPKQPSAMVSSKDEICAVCLETMMEKASNERCFGILSKCEHCFCLDCIMQWRDANEFDHISCPVCRERSKLVCPSVLWMDTTDEKIELISDYLFFISKGKIVND